MKSNSIRSIILALCCGTAPAAFAAEIACPDLATAAQVAPCPSEEELQVTFHGYCGDDSRMYAKGKDMDTCVSYENYRALKNIALWEAAGGEFQAYVSCDLAPAKVKAAKASKVTVGTAGKLTRIACDYGEGIVFAHRTRATCKVGGKIHPLGECAGESCKADCE